MKKLLTILLVLFSFEFLTAQSWFNCGTSIVADADGNHYNSIKIGSRCWLKENMRSTHYSNGMPAGIPTLKSGFQQLINVPGKLQVARYMSKEEPVTVEIYNLEGKSVYNSNIQGIVGNNLIEISTGPVGIFLVRIQCNEIESTIKAAGKDENGLYARLLQTPFLFKPETIVTDLNPRYIYDYENDPLNSEKYGKLYTSASALNCDYSMASKLEKVIQGICPEGWHVSNDSDWRQLEVTIGIDSNLVYSGPMFEFIGTVADKLKTPDTAYWFNAFGTDDFSFSARGSGGYWPSHGDGFTGLKDRSTWLTYSKVYGLMIQQITNFRTGIYRGFAYPVDAHSIRCVKNY